MTERVLIAGASGLVGFAALRHFATRPGTEVVAVSRRPPLATFGARFLSLDLLDARACADRCRELGGVTRLVYAALYEKPGLVAGWLAAEQIETNRRMLENLLEPLLEASPEFRHLTLLQGTKAYGADVRPIPIPAREDRSELRELPNFYWSQERLVRERQEGRGWHWTILRPQIIIGLSLGAAMNLIPAIGVYAALCKERGEAFAYPGGEAPVLEAVDADLLARAIDWAGSAPQARNQAFNVTNGDVFCWPEVWPAIADALGVEVGEPCPQRLGETLPVRDAEWERIRKRYALRSPPPPALVSTIKLRRAGFHEVMDTEWMFRKWFGLFQRQQLLPPRG